MAENIKNQTTGNYDENQIQVLEGLEAVRKRPGMYIGTTSEKGLHHLVYEIVDNSIDEALAGHCDTITVTLHKDNSVSVQDNGRGVPSRMHQKMGIPTLEVVFTVLHAGGKFGGEGYKIAGGLHGVGASVVNALSEWMEVDNCFDGHRYTERFERGKVAREFKDEGDACGKHGLYVRFKPDPEIFEETVFNVETLAKRVREQAFLNAGIRIILIDDRKDEPEEFDFCYEGGLKSYVEYLNNEKKADPIHEDVIYMKEEKNTSTAEVALQFNDSYSSVIMSFANNMNTIDGGTHEIGFKTGITKVINDYGHEKNILKEKEKLTSDDIMEGICVVISVKLVDAQFESQTKAKLGNSEIRSLVYSMVLKKLGEYLEENPKSAKIIIEKSISSCRAREAAKRARELARNSAGPAGGGRPDKLADCHEKRKEFTELYLVEGDSAGGTAKTGRDSQYQAILPLRGKVLNVEKTRLDKVYSNQSLIPIIQALGCGIGEDFDIEKLRYGKIIIMADADVDGSHIRILLLTFFFRHMRELIDRGHIYLAQPPLYKMEKGKQIRYAFSDEERDQILEEMGGNIKADRYKGLGEMNAEQLWETTMDPETRTILKVTVEDAMECDKTFSLLMGDKVEPRREFIEANAKYVTNLDI
ncbi:MAG: DNA topoisomerase (ATP-hydrolyzing) subunit B [Ruminococcaceae bacterium]|nr:DNA topoisomerase (ATP-hydrolyzing) subunit B [Oscillospiraceae bacterium]